LIGLGVQSLLSVIDKMWFACVNCRIIVVNDAEDNLDSRLDNQEIIEYGRCCEYTKFWSLDGEGIPARHGGGTFGTVSGHRE
jgi:hypothetical protein